MDANETVACPVCGERNLAIARRCGSCAALRPVVRPSLPAAAPDGPGGTGASTTADVRPAPAVVGYAGRVTVTPEKAAELRRHAVKACSSLLAVAVIYGVFAALSFSMAVSPGAPLAQIGIVISLAFLSGVYLVLALWAGFQPFAAAVAALAFFLLLLAGDLLVWAFGPPAPRLPGVAASDARGARVLAICFAVLIRMVVAALIVRALGYGMVRRQLRREA